MKIGNEVFDAQLVWEEKFTDLSRWRQLEPDGLWTVRDGGLVGEWIRNSPSLFFQEKIAGDFLWQMTATRLRPGQAFIERYRATKWGQANPGSEKQYNFNWWIRADHPAGGDFFATYPSRQGEGWNGMGDEYWRSLYTTLVRDPKQNWVRLRRSPGYEKVRDVQEVVPFLPYGEPHEYTFAVQGPRVRMWFDGRPVYDYEDPAPMESGYIGLCVWLCVVRFEKMRMYRV